ncbi:DNA modification system-associated small protein [Bacillus salitolerans]|uniref:DNA modification system-associated small protein n=1 Tax=Bacillus salitolerans TaxID=1437434 RepID=A0ABW4LYL1_9BACI
MSNIKDQELELLAKVSKENNIPIKLVHTLLKTAEKFSYENQSASARKKEYLNLINFHRKQVKGDQ